MFTALSRWFWEDIDIYSSSCEDLCLLDSNRPIAADNIPRETSAASAAEYSMYSVNVALLQPLSVGSHPPCPTCWRSHIFSPIDWGRSPVTVWAASLCHNYEDPAAMTQTNMDCAIGCWKYDGVTAKIKAEQIITTTIRMNNVRSRHHEIDNDEQRWSFTLKIWAIPRDILSFRDSSK